MNKDIFILFVLTLICSLLVFAAQGREPEVELRITDTNQVFDVTVVDGQVNVVEGPAINPDMIVSMNTGTFASIFESKDPSLEVYNQYKAGNIQSEVVTDYATLILKGYKKMYDSFAASHSIVAE